jgi:hypothetical protein
MEFNPRARSFPDQTLDIVLNVNHSALQQKTCGKDGKAKSASAKGE